MSEKRVYYCPVCNSPYLEETSPNHVYRISDSAKRFRRKIVESLSWMIEDMKHRHEETGIGGDYSPELKQAIEINEILKQGLD